MMLDNIRALIREGKVEGAIELVLSLEDKKERFNMLCYIIEELGPAFTEYPAIMDEIHSLLGDFEGPERAEGMACLAHSLWVAGADESERYMRGAIKEAKDIDDPLWRSEALARVASYMARMGLAEDAIYYFNIALETLRSLKLPYSMGIQKLKELADLLVETGDYLSESSATEFYWLAKEIYNSLSLPLRAAEMDAKIRIVNEATEERTLAVVKALETGDMERAIALVKYLTDEERIAALLEIAYWLVIHDRKDLAMSLISDAFDAILREKIKPADTELMSSAKKFIKIGLLDEALVLAGAMEDRDEASLLLKDIALALARRGERGKALNIALGISNDRLREETLRRLEGDVGHE
ncbi:hypothetical protein [Palaeococcus ferrophilus]|uniref:hypothetical protein n=1 Tax=Palaeococcus ferrophilus TaxID=83868 RepID=UPI00064E8BC5|nr:hypothetical protein [Palaeococcus ferrophilus]